MVAHSSLSGTYSLLAASAIGGLVLPLALSSLLPHAAKTAILASSLAASSTLAILNKSQYLERATIYQREVDNLRRNAHKRQLAREAMTADLEEKIDHIVEICVTLADLPPQIRNQQLVQMGMPELIPLFDPPKPPPPPKEPLPLVALTAEGSEESGGELAEIIAWYSECKRQHMMFVGNQGEGKTNACHFALYSWLATATPDDFPIIYVFDPHYGSGRDPRYASTWLGIPKADEVPKTVSTCVFHGEPDDLEAWFRPIMRLYKHRKINEIDISRGARPVIIVIDELTNHLGIMNDAKAKAVIQVLKELATGAPKFGFSFWGIVHDLAESNTAIPRTLYRQCHIVMGAGMSQDTAQVSCSPKKFSSHTLEYAAVVSRNTPPKTPAGYVTSLPVPDGFLPPAPLTNKEMELQWLPEQTELRERDPYEDWDDQLENRYGIQPEDVWEETWGDKDKFEPEPEIKSRDINQGNIARDWFVALEKWFRDLGRNPSDDEIRAAWQQVSGKDEPLTDNAIAYLRAKLKGNN